MTDRKKIGLFGGTFNPIHRGHVSAARAVAEKLSLLKVIFIPSSRPPHKELEDKTAPSHRLAMVKLAIAGDPLLGVSDIEVARGGESYTLFTLKEMRKNLPQAHFTFILGVDAYLEISAWHRFKEVLPLVDWAVIGRPGYRLPDLANPLKDIAAAFHGKDGNVIMRDDPPTRIFFLAVPETDISSSDVRAAVRLGGPIRNLVPDAVAAYIEKNGLYK